MMKTTETFAKNLGLAAACNMLGVPRSSLYRARQPKAEAKPRPRPKRALTADDKTKVHQVLNSERFVDLAPRQVYASLLDDDIYLCHWRTMYRILDEHQESNERRNQLKHPPTAIPRLEATGPRQLWSWDITKLPGPAKWAYHYLYVILDVYSRFVVGWMVAAQENAELAEILITKTCQRENIPPEKLALHSDRGAAMRSKTVAQLLIDLHIAQSFSRPYTPNDNPYSEAQFKTLKYRPNFPDRFDTQQQARLWSQNFFDWYNYHHYHAALGLLTPAVVHFDQVRTVQTLRQKTLDRAYNNHPERFVKGKPAVTKLPKSVWINPPEIVEETGK